MRNTANEEEGLTQRPQRPNGPAFFQAKPLRPAWLKRLSVQVVVHLCAHKTLWHRLQATRCPHQKTLIHLFEACLTAAVLVFPCLAQRIGFHCISPGSLCTAGGQHGQEEALISGA